jgi:hypothetical protein
MLRISPKTAGALEMRRWDIMQRKNCTARLSRYVCNWTLVYAASNSRRAKMSFFTAAEPGNLYCIFNFPRRCRELDASVRGQYTFPLNSYISISCCDFISSSIRPYVIAIYAVLLGQTNAEVLVYVQLEMVLIHYSNIADLKL